MTRQDDLEKLKALRWVCIQFYTYRIAEKIKTGLVIGGDHYQAFYAATMFFVLASFPASLGSSVLPDPFGSWHTIFKLSNLPNPFSLIFPF
jgi:hypothetical protein